MNRSILLHQLWLVGISPKSQASAQFAVIVLPCRWIGDKNLHVCDVLVSFHEFDPVLRQGLFSAMYDGCLARPVEMTVRTGKRLRFASDARMQALYVICCVGLTPAHLGNDTPHLSKLAGRGLAVPLASTIPAVTCSAQATMLTGVDPSQHGIVGNGWHFRDLNEVWLWRQSQALVQAPHVWQRQPWRVLKHFWWYAMNTGTTATVTPRPTYHQDGRKGPDCYAWPPELKDRLVQQHGDFPLFHFWGPATSIASSRWIADSFTTAVDQIHPDLALCYLPHLDYDLQRYGPTGNHVANNLRDVDNCIGIILEHAKANRARVVVVSEYGISAVSQACAINRFLRERKFLSVIRNATGELIDYGFSRAFAVVDHQIAHISVRNSADIPVVREALQQLPGIGRLYIGGERADIGLEHPRSGEIIALAEADAWFCHDWWLDEQAKPDFANCVEIHKKPGYDPRELFFDQHGGKRRAALALLRKKLGLRYVMNAISSNPSLVGGSHGLPACDPAHGAILIGDQADDLAGRNWHQRDIAGLIGHILG